VPDRDKELVPMARFRAPNGALIAEADLTDGHHRAVDDLVARARLLGADRFGDVWGHHDPGPPDPGGRVRRPA